MEVDLSQLPGGKRCVIEAYCSDGILTGRAKSKPFKVGHKKPRAIISTEDGSFKVKGGAIRLLGAGLDDAGKPVSTDRLSWSSDKDGDLGAGDLLETPLSRGTHKISLVVKDDEGRVSRENITLQVN